MLSASSPQFSSCPRKIITGAEFQRYWGAHLNFRLGGECIPFDYAFPPLESLVEALRSDPEARILRGKKGDRADEKDISEEFRALPLEKAVAGPFQMSHFNLSNFDGQGEILWGLREQVMTPWKSFLREAGFSWRRCFPILFVSGPDSATNYHMDLSQVLAWQVYGIKTFNGFKNPSKWAPLQDSVREDFRERMSRPREIEPEEILSFVMEPGQFLWNQLLTPHWVDAGNQVAVSLNISHGGLRYRGNLCAAEQALEEWWLSHPNEVWRGPEDVEFV